MSFLIKNHYLICSTPAFDAKLAQFDQNGLAGLLREPMLWTRDEIGRSDAYIITAKLLFLCYLLAEYSGNSEFDRIFDELEISLQYFDTRWSIQQLDEFESFEFVESVLTPEIVERIPQTNDEYIESWKDSLRAKANNRIRLDRSTHD